MKIIKTKLNNVFIIQKDSFEDKRGSFQRIFCRNSLKKLGISIKQTNVSISNNKGTIRGLHYQVSPNSEDKLVYCAQGEIFDVAVDIRKKSKTYMKYVSIKLKPNCGKMLLVGKGCAHGFLTLKDNSVVVYNSTSNYEPTSERTLFWKSKQVKIKWPKFKKYIVSEKDSLEQN